MNFPPAKTAVVAEYFCSVADASDAPKSALKIAQAALSHLYKVQLKAEGNPMDSLYISMLMSSLVKSATYRPLVKSKVMPVKPFAELFKRWPDNDQLCIKDLRLKAITLMALTLMLRPSDIAPKAVHFNGQTLEQNAWLFTTENVCFLDSGSATVVFHGIKNDTSRSGFEVQMQPTDNPKLNPVRALQVRLKNLGHQRDLCFFP